MKLHAFLIGPGANCLKIHLNFLSFPPHFIPIIPPDLPKFPQIIIEHDLANILFNTWLNFDQQLDTRFYKAGICIYMCDASEIEVMRACFDHSLPLPRLPLQFGSIAQISHPSPHIAQADRFPLKNAWQFVPGPTFQAAKNSLYGHWFDTIFP